MGRLAHATSLDEYKRLHEDLEEQFHATKTHWFRTGFSDMGTPLPLIDIRSELDNLNTITEDSPFAGQLAILRDLLERAESAAIALEELPRARWLLEYRVAANELYKTYADQVDTFVEQDQAFGMSVLGILNPRLTAEQVEALVKKMRGEK